MKLSLFSTFVSEIPQLDRAQRNIARAVDPIVKALLAPPVFKALTLATPWSNYGQGHRALSSATSLGGVVVVSGRVSATDPNATDSLIAVLPESQWPQQGFSVAAAGEWSATAQTPRISVGSNGEIRLVPDPGAAVTFLDIHFSFLAGA